MRLSFLVFVLLCSITYAFHFGSRVWRPNAMFKMNMAKRNKNNKKQIFSQDVLDQLKLTLGEDEEIDMVTFKRKKIDKPLPDNSTSTAKIEEEVIQLSKYELKLREKGKDLEAKGDTIAEPDESESKETLHEEKVEGPKKTRFKRLHLSGNNKLSHVMIGLNKVSMSFGDADVLKDASFTVSTGEKVGLVGANGAGKTLQLQILNGDIEPDDGEITISSDNVKTAYLHQEFSESLLVDYTVKEELWRCYPEEFEIMKKFRDLEAAVSSSATDESTDNSELRKELDAHRALAVKHKCFVLEGKILKVLDATGFSVNDTNKLVGDFSGGWKMRIGIAKIFLQDPNVLLMDEPTNHLDLDAMIWLESFLIKQTMPVVIVSHDREFLNNVCNKIVDIDMGVTKTYKGNYANFLDTKKNDQIIWVSNYAKQCVEVAGIQAFIKKNKDVLHMAQPVANKEALLKRMMASPEWLDPPPKPKKYRFKFPPAPRSNEMLYEASQLSKQFDDAPPLFENLNLKIKRGSRIGMVGPNGSGKSTLARIVAGLEKPTNGQVDYKDNKLRINYYAQNQADALNLGQTVYETIQEAAFSNEEIDDGEIRSLLAQFMFKRNDVDKKIGVLSGGEKARVALCKMLIKPANLLIFDEPTNHLDIVSKEALEFALTLYGGALLVISHDRYFMSKVATTILTFDGRHVQQHDCDYYNYLHNEDIVSPDLKAAIETRQVYGDVQQLTTATPVVPEKVEKKKNNFGGSGVPNNYFGKGIKNAKRFKDNPYSRGFI